jgi:hypothetical protein
MAPPKMLINAQKEQIYRVGHCRVWRELVEYLELLQKRDQLMATVILICWMTEKIRPYDGGR